MAAKIRTVRYEEQASAAWDKLQKEEPRFAEIQRGVEWTIARRPELGRQVSVTGLHVVFTRGGKLGIVPFAFFYRFTANDVSIEDIIRADEPET